ncbi:MAG TPA: tyrosine-type recombinase/integrase, partial [Stellaceae bacterium]|nr:tyrosine-type recombinase/integrase [Stellaceae bacterium]
MTGHVRRRGERSWELKFDLGRDPLSGKRITRFHSFKGTRRDAEKELTRLMAGADSGTYVDPTKTTVADFLDRWERDWAASNLSPKTLERHREISRVHVRPHLGDIRLQKLKAAHLQGLYAKLLREGRTRVDAEGTPTTLPPLSARTVGHVHRLLHRALGHAVTWGEIATNPASAVQPPKVESTEIEILSEEQARTVLQKLRGRSLYLIVAVLLSTGMRRGEALALRWKDVDLEGARIRVEQSLEQTKAGGLRFKTPKTKHGRRSITIPPAIVTELRAHWKDHQEQRLALGLGKAPGDALVFQK